MNQKLLNKAAAVGPVTHEVVLRQLKHAIHWRNLAASGPHYMQQSYRRSMRFWSKMVIEHLRIVRAVPKVREARPIIEMELKEAA